MRVITSVQNNQVKEWKKLHRKKYRIETNTFLIEGMHLIEEAFNSDWEIETVIVQEEMEAPTWMNEENVVFVTKRVFKEISQTEAPQGIAAIVNMKTLIPKKEQYVLLIDAIQDPGNLGTMIRTADAAGFSKVVLGNGTVDVFNDKVIRATQGSLFHIPIEQANLADAIRELQQNDFTVWASTLRKAVDFSEMDAKEKSALIVGNEGAGINEQWVEMADKLVKIPIYGEAESLNVSVAAGILMYKMRK